MTAETMKIMFNYFDKWKNDEPDEVESKSTEEIAHILFHHPLNNLLTNIMEKNIDGKLFINNTKENSFMEAATGWDKNDIYQIQSVLLKHHTFSRSQFIQNMNNILTQTYSKSLTTDVINRITEVILQFDVEEIHYKIKNGKNIDEFSDKIINLVDELIEKNTNEYDNNFVTNIYEFISECFIFNDNSIDNDYDLISSQRQHWICNNCSNFNFHIFVASNMKRDLSSCTLCGIKQRDSIILKLRDIDTYITTTHAVNTVEKTVDDTGIKEDEFDMLLKQIQFQKSVNILCPNRMDNEPCPSIMRLARQLLNYNKWIATVHKVTNGKDNIDNTVNINIEEIINDKMYKIIFQKSAEVIDKITADNEKSLKQMLDNDNDGISNLATFLSLNRKQFAICVKKYTKIKPCFGIKLYKKILNTLRETSLSQRFDSFLSTLDVQQLDKDYHHILQCHITNGTKKSIESVFRFFGMIVHYNDTDTEIEKCRSFNRRQERVQSQTNQTSQATDEKNQLRDDAKDKNIWHLNQYYIQSKLDIIHAYLSHSNWKYFVARYSKDDETDLNLSEMNLQNTVDASIINDKQKKSKYITDSAETNLAKYGFGFDFSHPYLSPIYFCLRDEVLCNILCKLSEEQFDYLMIKALNLHPIALGEDYKDELICKYYNSEYNIIRSDPIAIRHILSIIIYTDMSAFCTAFRKTYRKIHDDETEEDVKTRHIQLYFYARYLFEAIEFYGQPMDIKTQVYHGLNRVMMFERFTAYLNQHI
eukprot:38846_1